MRRLLCILFCLSILVLLSAASFADNRGVIVHVTETGTKYHSFGCRYLKSDIKMTLEKAANNGYTRCSVCNPPIPDFEVSATPMPDKQHGHSYSSEVKSSASPFQSQSVAETVATFICIVLLIGVVVVKLHDWFF